MGTRVEPSAARARQRYIGNGKYRGGFVFTPKTGTEPRITLYEESLVLIWSGKENANASQNLELKEALPLALPATMLTILSVCLPLFSTCSLNQSAYAAGPIQPPSCEHPNLPPPVVPYPSNLNQVPVNAPSFPPPGSEPAPVVPGEPIQPPSCEHPPLPPLPIPRPPGQSQVPVNAPCFPVQPTKPYCPVQYGCLPFHSNPACIVPGAGNYPGVGIQGETQYGVGTTTLRDPLVPGASWASPGYPAPLGLLPPIGSGYTPDPVNPGMLGEPPSLVPWANGTAGNPYSQPTNTVVIPANQIDQQESAISLPITNMSAQAPGTWNSSIRGIIPKAPSTPGADPGMLKSPSFIGGTSNTNGGTSNWAGAVAVPLPDNGQLPAGVAATSRSMQRGQTNDFGLSQKTPTKKTNFAYRMQISPGQDGEPTFNGWKGLPGSTTQDFGVGVSQLQAQGKLGSKQAPQISYDAARPAEYPGGQGSTGSLSSTSPGNHGHNAAPLGFASAQVTNDLYGTPMINPNRTYTGGSGLPLTTIAPY